MAAAIDESLGKVGLHQHTKHYSITNEIESDHPLPCEVWKRTKNTALNKVAKGAGSRPGENNMPAITIPYATHRILKTTIDDAFRDTLRIKCDAGNVRGALADVIQDYKDNQLLGAGADPRYKVAWVETLEYYKEMKIINLAEKAALTAIL